MIGRGKEDAGEWRKEERGGRREKECEEEERKMLENGERRIGEVEEKGNVRKREGRCWRMEKGG